MTVRLIDAEDRIFEIAIEALRGDALRRRRAAETFSGELESDRAAGRQKDIRTGALHVVKLLGEADALEHLAAELADPTPPQLALAAGPAAAEQVGPGGLAVLTPEPGGDGGPDPVTDPDVLAAATVLAGGHVPSSLQEDTDPAAVAGALVGPGAPVIPE